MDPAARMQMVLRKEKGKAIERREDGNYVVTFSPPHREAGSKQTFDANGVSLLIEFTPDSPQYKTYSHLVPSVPGSGNVVAHTRDGGKHYIERGVTKRFEEADGTVALMRPDATPHTITRVDGSTVYLDESGNVTRKTWVAPHAEAGRTHHYYRGGGCSRLVVFTEPHEKAGTVAEYDQQERLVRLVRNSPHPDAGAKIVEDPESKIRRETFGGEHELAGTHIYYIYPNQGDRFETDRYVIDDARGKAMVTSRRLQDDASVHEMRMYIQPKGAAEWVDLSAEMDMPPLRLPIGDSVDHQLTMFYHAHAEELLGTLEDLELARATAANREEATTRRIVRGRAKQLAEIVQAKTAALVASKEAEREGRLTKAMAIASLGGDPDAHPSVVESAKRATAKEASLAAVAEHKNALRAQRDRMIKEEEERQRNVAIGNAINTE